MIDSNKILINTSVLCSPLSGVGNYTYQIAKGLAELGVDNEYTYFYGYRSKTLHLPKREGRFSLWIKKGLETVSCSKRILRELRGKMGSLSRESFDLYFEPNLVPLMVNARRKVATVHDFSLALHPDWHPHDRVEYFRQHFWQNIKECDRIIVVSDFVREACVGEYGFPADKVVRIHNGYDSEVFRRYKGGQLEGVRTKYRIPERFILFVGSIEPRKNLEGLLRAYMQLPEGLKAEYKLLLVGFSGWQNAHIMSLINKLKDHVSYIGYVPFADLGMIYNLASLFVYPSFYEGFGLPPLEAMACGCPTVTSNVSSLPEVCDDAAYYIDPHDIESIRHGICTVLQDGSLGEVLVSKGLRRAQEFSWVKSTRDHLRLFDSLL